MRFRVKSNFERLVEKERRRVIQTYWHRVFAWSPRLVGEECEHLVWLEFYERRVKPGCEFRYEYRLATKVRR